MKDFNITAVIISAVTITVMLVLAPFSMHKERVCEFPEFSKTSEYKININTADENELSILKGLGEVTARAIVDYRNENGDFKSIYDLDNVRGIGETKISTWQDYITLEN